MRRASATVCSRCCSASSVRPVQISTIPSCISACARSSLAEPGRHQRHGLRRKKQLLRHLRDRRHVVSRSGDGQAQGGAGDLELSAAILGHGRELARGERQVPLGRHRRAIGQLVCGGDELELWIGGDGLGGKRSQQLARGRPVAVEEDAEPVVCQQPRRQAPVLGRLGVTDRLDRVPVLGQPLGSRGMQTRRAHPRRCVAARAPTGRRTAGGSETRSAADPTQPRTHPPARAPSTSDPRPSPRSSDRPARR